MKYISMILTGLVVFMLMVGCDYFGVGSIEYSVTADFNSDGIEDMLTVETRTKSLYHQISLALGTGENAFQKSIPVLKISREKMKDINTLEYRDYDGDGNMDFMVGNFTTQAEGRIRFGIQRVIYGNGDGSFQEEEGVEVIK